MIQTRSNDPTTSHAPGNSSGNGNGTGAITSTPDAVQALFGMGVITRQLQTTVATLSAIGGSRHGNGATQAPRDPIIEHDATSQHKGKKTRRCRRRPDKALVFEEVLVGDIPEGQDDDSNKGRVSAFKRLRGEETRVSTGSTMDATASKAIYAGRCRRAGGGTPRNRQPRI
ncbi:unnamed protein product [Cuscuta campestris]|uniref:Uncharacterized protein n=1 Tax=Cuscuta campestris TaxID=132261 RepID=A0A484M3W3_9ASTE|nr:unnamed protein product [Cuscuta campestris]